MAKDYSKGDEWRLYLDTASNWSSPTWAQIKAFVDPTIDPEKGDVEINEQNEDTGHLHGSGNPSLGFTLILDKGDANVETLIANSLNGAITHLALSRGDISVNTTKYWHMESLLNAPLAASRGSVASLDMTARRHANSDNQLTRATI